MESEVVSTPNRNEVVVVDLPAPPGWMKKFTPKKGTPRRSNVFFISPTGETIKNPRQLEQYVKSHPGNPSSSEFDWGAGDSPRRSARLSEKSKAEETPESENPKKSQRKLSSKKEAKGTKDDSEGEHETTTEKTADAIERESPKKKQKKSSPKKEAKGKRDESEREDETTEVAADGNKESVEIAMEDAADSKNQDELEITQKEVVAKEVPDKDDAKENLQIMDETETKKPENQETSDAKGVSSISLLTVTAYPDETHKEEKVVDDEIPADKGDVKSSTENVVGETNVDKTENQEISDEKEQGAENMSLSTPAINKNNKEVESTSLPVPAVEANNKEAEKEVVLTEPATDEQDSVNKDAVPEVVADAKVEKQIADAKVGQGDHHEDEVPSEGCKTEEAKVG